VALVYNEQLITDEFNANVKSTWLLKELNVEPSGGESNVIGSAIMFNILFAAAK
jgi:hypothetical protein